MMRLLVALAALAWLALAVAGAWYVAGEDAARCSAQPLIGGCDQ